MEELLVKVQALVDMDEDYLEAIVPELVLLAEQETGLEADDIKTLALFCAKGAQFMQRDISLQSKSLGDYSETIAGGGMLPKAIMDILPKRVRFV